MKIIKAKQVPPPKSHWAWAGGVRKPQHAAWVGLGRTFVSQKDPNFTLRFSSEQKYAAEGQGAQQGGRSARQGGTVPHR